MVYYYGMCSISSLLSFVQAGFILIPFFTFICNMRQGVKHGTNIYKDAKH